MVPGRIEEESPKVRLGRAGADAGIEPFYEHTFLNVKKSEQMFKITVDKSG